MNTKQAFVVVLMLMVLSTNAFSKKNNPSQDQQTVTIEGVFDGYDDEDGYSFLTLDKDDEDRETYIFFTEISKEALKAVNLKSDDFIGKRFEITYEITEYEEEDEMGNVDVYEKYTITKLKKL